MEHKIEYMTIGRIKCLCGWRFDLEDRDAFGTPAGNNRLLDAYNTHVASTRQASEGGG